MKAEKGFSLRHIDAGFFGLRAAWFFFDCDYFVGLPNVATEQIMPATKKEIHAFLSHLVTGVSDHEARMRMQDVLMEVLFSLNDRQRQITMEKVALEMGCAQVFGKCSDFLVYMVDDALTQDGQTGWLSCAVTNDTVNEPVGAEAIEFLFSGEDTKNKLLTSHKFSGEGLGYAKFRSKDWQIHKLSAKTEFGVTTMSVSLIPMTDDRIRHFGLLDQLEAD